MNTIFTYHNANDDLVIVAIDNGAVVSVLLFGFDIVRRLTEHQKAYILALASE